MMILLGLHIVGPYDFLMLDILHDIRASVPEKGQEILEQSLGQDLTAETQVHAIAIES